MKCGGYVDTQKRSLEYWEIYVLAKKRVCK